MYKFVNNSKDLLDPKINESVLSLRKIALKSLEIGIESVLPENLINKAIMINNDVLTIYNDNYDLSKYKKIYIIGGGKASFRMALSLEEKLQKASNLNYFGIINAPDNGSPALKRSKITLFQANHPIPNQIGLNGTKEMVELVKKSSKHDLIICLISGGGSALMTLPKPGISLDDIKKINSLLLKSGASIYEINTIRKHISDFKGGNLAKIVYNHSGAILISLIISDVVGNMLDSIASGPTVPDPTTYKDALKILYRYDLYNKTPHSVIKVLEAGAKDVKLENPKMEDPCFENVFNYLIGSAETAIQEISEFLGNAGFMVNLLTNEIQGEARVYGNSLAQDVKEILLDDGNNYPRALLGSGELTVTIIGNGIGGRNQEMLLSFLKNILQFEIKRNFLILGANVDGIEGNSKAMGAIVDDYVLSEVLEKNIDLVEYLNQNDSNSFFSRIKSQIISGPTGCNVNDLLIILIQ